MTPQRFTQILEAYGAEPARWPDAEREAAKAFAADRPAALAEARRLDALLGAFTDPAPTAALQAAILASRPQPIDWRPWSPKLGAGLAAASIAGLLFGAGVTRAITMDVRADAAVAAAMDDTSATADLGLENS